MGVEHFVASLTHYHIRLIMQEVALFARFASQGLIHAEKIPFTASASLRVGRVEASSTCL